MCRECWGFCLASLCPLPVAVLSLSPWVPLHPGWSGRLPGLLLSVLSSGLDSMSINWSSAVSLCFCSGSRLILHVCPCVGSPSVFCPACNCFPPNPIKYCQNLIQSAVPALGVQSEWWVCSLGRWGEPWEPSNSTQIQVQDHKTIYWVLKTQQQTLAGLLQGLPIPGLSLSHRVLWTLLKALCCPEETQLLWQLWTLFLRTLTFWPCPNSPPV